MKTAVILNGNIRTISQTKSNIISTFEHLNPDYFISTYYNQYGYHPCIQNMLNYYDDPILTKDEVIQNFNEFNNPSFIIEDNNDLNIWYNEESKKFNVFMKDHPSSYLQYRKVLAAFNLIKMVEKQYNMYFDLIIKTRCDIVHNGIQDIDFTNIKDKFVISTGNVYPNDCILISERNNMENVIEFMITEFYNYTNFNSNINPPHGLLECAIQKYNLKIKEYPIMNHVIRANRVQYY